MIFQSELLFLGCWLDINSIQSILRESARTETVDFCMFLLLALIVFILRDVWTLTGAQLYRCCINYIIEDFKNLTFDKFTAFKAASLISLSSIALI